MQAWWSVPFSVSMVNFFMDRLSVNWRCWKRVKLPLWQYHDCRRFLGLALSSDSCSGLWVFIYGVEELCQWWNMVVWKYEDHCHFSTNGNHRSLYMPDTTHDLSFSLWRRANPKCKHRYLLTGVIQTFIILFFTFPPTQPNTLFRSKTFHSSVQIHVMRQRPLPPSRQLGQPEIWGPSSHFLSERKVTIDL